MKSNNIFSQSLGREIIQVGFRPTLQWLSARSSTASQLVDQYEEWRSDGGNVALFSPKARNALEVYTSQITFVSENQIDSEKGIVDLTKILPGIVKNFDIKEIRRVGCRRTCIFSSKFKFSEITNLIFRRLFTSNKQLSSIQGKIINDLTFVLDSESDGYKFHVQIGAVKKEEGLKIYARKFESNEELDSDNNLFIDIDASISKGLSKTNIIDQLKKVREKNHETILKYIDYLTT